MIHSDDKPFKCDNCDKCFRDNNGLRSHAVLIHPQLFPDLPLLKWKENGCQYSTENSYRYNYHLLSHSLPFECNICQKKFTTKYRLKYHEFTHREDKTLECSECQKKFRSPLSLRMHMRSHEPNNHDKKYLCEWPECGKRFPTKQKMEWHMNTHKSLKPYHCDLPDCDKAYANRLNRDSHKRDTHRITSIKYC